MSELPKHETSALHADADTAFPQLLDSVVTELQKSIPEHRLRHILVLLAHHSPQLSREVDNIISAIPESIRRQFEKQLPHRDKVQTVLDSYSRGKNRKENTASLYAILGLLILMALVILQTGNSTQPKPTLSNTVTPMVCAFRQIVLDPGGLNITEKGIAGYNHGSSVTVLACDKLQLAQVGHTVSPLALPKVDDQGGRQYMDNVSERSPEPDVIFEIVETEEGNYNCANYALHRTWPEVFPEHMWSGPYLNTILAQLTEPVAIFSQSATTEEHIENIPGWHPNIETQIVDLSTTKSETYNQVAQAGDIIALIGFAGNSETQVTHIGVLVDYEGTLMMESKFGYLPVMLTTISQAMSAYLYPASFENPVPTYDDQSVVVILRPKQASFNRGNIANLFPIEELTREALRWHTP